MKKMTLADLKALFNMYTPRVSPSKPGKHDASKRGFKHVHGMSKGQRKDAARAITGTKDRRVRPIGEG